MSRYTDTDALYEKGHYDDFDVYVVDWETIEKAPTADVVEVIRCKDCRYCSDSPIFHNKTICAIHYNEYGGHKICNENGFCFEGERR